MEAFMTAIGNDYVKILNENRIHFVPSCLVVEMLTRLYSQVSRITLSGDACRIVPDLMALLGRMSRNIAATTDAYRRGRIGYFPGDWREDKLRARKLFFNIMSRLGYISTLLGERERRLLHRSVAEMTDAWADLDRVMEDKKRLKLEFGHCGACRHFGCDSLDCWRRFMAQAVLKLESRIGKAADDRPDVFLILLCYHKVKAALVGVIAEIEREQGSGFPFSADRILSISNEDLAISCPKCSLMNNALRRGDSMVIHKEYAGAAVPAGGARPAGGRREMPPSLTRMVRFS